MQTEWYHWPTLMIFGYMVLSPVRFFKTVDEVVLQEPDEADTLYITDDATPFSNGDSMEQIQRDEKILNNLNRMVQMAASSDAKKMWEIKKAEFERQLRWKRYNQYGTPTHERTRIH